MTAAIHPEGQLALGRQQIGDETMRYLLRQRWAPGPVIGWVGMNPSRAAVDVTDPTWRRMRGFAELWGYGGQVVLNPVPLRSADPDEAIAALRRIANANTVEPKTNELLSALGLNLAIAERYAGGPIAWVIGWGDAGRAMNDAWRVHARFMQALRQGGVRNFLAFGLTAGGAPKHVLARGRLRIPDDAILRYYDHARGELLGIWRHPNQPRVSIPYCKRGGPPMNWASCRVLDAETGEPITDVLEANAAEGWFTRYALDADGARRTEPNAESYRLLIERIDRPLRIEAPAP